MRPRAAAAVGTPEEPICFTRSSAGARWDQILFVHADDSRLAYCTVEFADSAGDHKDYYDNDCNPETPMPTRKYHEAITALATHLDIESCTFQHLPDDRPGGQGDAIAIISDDPELAGEASAHISNCRFLSIGTGIHTRYSYVLVEGCFFTGHNGDNDDADLYGESTPPPMIRNNVMLSPNHDDMINPTRCSAIIMGNIIGNCDDHGVVLRDKCTPVLINNVIFNCASAGVAVQNQCNALVINNTIVNCGRGVRFFDHDGRWDPPYCLFPGSGTATIINCIIRDCATTFDLANSPWTEDRGSHAAVSYCNVEGGLGRANVSSYSTLTWGEGNIDADPLFADAGERTSTCSPPPADGTRRRSVGQTPSPVPASMPVTQPRRTGRRNSGRMENASTWGLRRDAAGEHVAVGRGPRGGFRPQRHRRPARSDAICGRVARRCNPDGHGPGSQRRVDLADFALIAGHGPPFRDRTAWVGVTLPEFILDGFEYVVGHRVRVRFVRKGTGSHVLDVLCKGLLHQAVEVLVTFGELWSEPVEQAEYIRADQQLARTPRAAADTHGRHAQLLRDPGGEFCGNGLDNNHERPRLLQRQGFSYHLAGRFDILALDLHAAEHPDSLGMEPDVADHGNTHLDNRTRLVNVVGPGLQLHTVGCSLRHKTGGVAHGVFHAVLEGPERHIRNDHRAGAGPETAAQCISIMSIVALSVLGYPWTTIAQESPTRTMSMPASLICLAVG